MVLYGLGKKSLAERLNCSEQEAEHIIQGLYTSFPKLREYIAGQQQYIFDNHLVNYCLYRLLFHLLYLQHNILNLGRYSYKFVKYHN